MKEHDVYIYTMTNPINDKIFYVGKTKIKNLKLRMYGHVKEAKHEYNKNIKKSKEILYIINNGFDINVDVLDIVSSKDWWIDEKYWISQLRTWGFDLTNISEGGTGNRRKVVGKKKYRTKKVYMYNKRGRLVKEYNSVKEACIDNNVTDGAIWTSGTSPINEKLRCNGYCFEYKKIENPKYKFPPKGSYGRKMSEETKEKIYSQTRGRKCSEEEIRKREKTRARPVNKYSLDGKFIKRYESVPEAIEDIDGEGNMIRAAIRGESKTAYGFIWRLAKKTA
jgi:hypothetical protein